VVCDLNEGSAPWRPRYIVPDYDAFLERGSAFLRIEPPKDLLGAAFALLGLYRQVPSITGYPVWIGDLDSLLGRFVPEGRELSPEEERIVALFMEEIDRSLPDSFCHGNLGPKASPMGRAILRHQRRAGRAVPNLTLRYDPELTEDAFAEEALLCALDAAKPSLANHRRFIEDFARLGLGRYAIASCYNGLPIGGGSLTLVRLNLAALVAPGSPGAGMRESKAFIAGPLAAAIEGMLAFIDERVRFILDESGFFESSFLVRERLIAKERFTAMFGLVGLAECVNALLADKSRRFGRDAEADALGLEILGHIDAAVAAHRNPALIAAGGRYLLHAQVGIETDHGVSPGCRIPIGEEPLLPEHLLRSAPFHGPFVSGIGDVFAFEPTARNNPGHILDAAKGFFAAGGRYFSCYAADSDLVRVTGYLVKRSEVERLRRGEVVQNGATVLGMGAFDNCGVMDRAVRE
jgi:YjjI family glycine radical enzyme